MAPDTAATGPWPQMLYVLTISHRHGETVSIYTTEEFAHEGLVDYVAEWYEQERGRPCPDEITDDVISDYFDSTNESWSIEESVIVR